MKKSRQAILRLLLSASLGFVSGVARAQQPPPSSPIATSTPILALDEVRAGMVGVGKTVFTGNQIEEFQAEILGVLRNVAPRQSIILARLSGGPLERTGVMAGMSGSPVYVDGRLIGAVALSFQFSKEPLAGITPIEQMLSALEEPEGTAGNRASLGWQAGTPDSVQLRAGESLPGIFDLLPKPNLSYQVFWGGMETSLVRMATPLVFAGFSSDVIEHYTPQLRTLGFVPLQGGGGGAAGDNRMGDISRLKPGSMISVELVRGDLGVHADGTITMLDNGRVYAFGHPFLSAGPTEMPFSESEVLANLPGYAVSMKISTPGGLLGVIRQDRASGILGMLGDKARMIPVELEVVSSRQTSQAYHFEVVNDRFLLPLLLNLATFSAIGATERLMGDSTLQVEQTITLNGFPEVKTENLISGNANAAALAARVAIAPLTYLMQSGLEPLDVRSIQLKVRSTDSRAVMELGQVWSDKRQVLPGDTVELTVLLEALDGKETVQKALVEIPPGLTPGPLTITVADGATMDRMQGGAGGRMLLPKDTGQLVRAINKSRRNNRLYVLLSRWERGFVLQGDTFPSPPPSVVRTLSADPSLSTGVLPTFLSPVADYELATLPAVVTGTRSITITVKE
ncbi:MAG: hypothetical protein HY649_11850 [Acidobacteria bacterium]|nr:hypothetical protein [Acidobacteriota bacterium]